MNKIKYILLSLIIITMFIPFNIKASEKITVYVFHGDTCPHCKEGMIYLESIKKDYPNMEVITYEVWNDDQNSLLHDKVKKYLKSDSKGVPFFVIGKRYLTGFAEYRKEDIKASIDYYNKNYKEYKDIVKEVIAGKDKTVDNKKEGYKAVDMNDLSKKRTYEQIFYYSVGAVILLIILIIIGTREKRVK